MEQTLNHLLSSSNELLGLGNSGKSNKLPQESMHTKAKVHSHGKKQNKLQPDVSSPTGDGKCYVRYIANYIVTEFKIQLGISACCVLLNVFGQRSD